MEFGDDSVSGVAIGAGVGGGLLFVLALILCCYVCGTRCLKQRDQRTRYGIIVRFIFIQIVECNDRIHNIHLTKFNKIAIQGAPQMAVDKEAISLSRVYSYYYKLNLLLFYV